jgi:hypothetical protein
MVLSSHVPPSITWNLFLLHGKNLPFSRTMMVVLLRVGGGLRNVSLTFPSIPISYGTIIFAHILIILFSLYNAFPLLISTDL